MAMNKEFVRFLLLDLHRAGYHDAMFDEENDRVMPIPENPNLWMNNGGVCFMKGASYATRDLAHGHMTDIFLQTTAF